MDDCYPHSPVWSLWCGLALTDPIKYDSNCIFLPCSNCLGLTWLITKTKHKPLKFCFFKIISRYGAVHKIAQILVLIWYWDRDGNGILINSPISKDGTIIFSARGKMFEIWYLGSSPRMNGLSAYFCSCHTDSNIF